MFNANTTQNESACENGFKSCIHINEGPGPSCNNIFFNWNLYDDKKTGKKMIQIGIKKTAPGYATVGFGSSNLNGEMIQVHIDDTAESGLDIKRATMTRHGVVDDADLAPWKLEKGIKNPNGNEGFWIV